MMEYGYNTSLNVFRTCDFRRKYCDSRQSSAILTMCNTSKEYIVKRKTSTFYYHIDVYLSRIRIDPVIPKKWQTREKRQRKDKTVSRVSYVSFSKEEKTVPYTQPTSKTMRRFSPLGRSPSGAHPSLYFLLLLFTPLTVSHDLGWCRQDSDWWRAQALTSIAIPATRQLRSWQIVAIDTVGNSVGQGSMWSRQTTTDVLVDSKE